MAGFGKTLEERLIAVEDQLAIQELVCGIYIRALDSHNWAAYADTFTEDAELLVFDRHFKSRKEILQFFTTPGNLPESGLGLGERKLMHIISNLLYKVEGNTATGTAYWQDLLKTGDTPPSIPVAGHYEDTLRKDAGVWKFRKRVIVTDMGALEPSPPKR